MYTSIKSIRYKMRLSPWIIFLGMVVFIPLRGQQLETAAIGATGSTLSDGTTTLHLHVGQVGHFHGQKLLEGVLQLLMQTTAVIPTAVYPDVRLFPNPAKDVLFIKTDISFESGMVVDLLGREIMRTNSHTASLDISPLRQGPYYFRPIKNKIPIGSYPFIKI